MKKFQTFQQFLATNSPQIPIIGFVLDLFLAAVLSFMLSRVYIKYGTSLSNRRMFARNFTLITMTTMLVIAIVKSSLALSLGLVGALSIVRFRAAIKEPEELAYLFVSIAIGLGFGADQRIITIVAIAVICAVVIIRSYFHKAEENKNLYLTVTSHSPEKLTLEQIVKTLKKHCPFIDLKRFDEAKDILEASFLIEFDNIESLHQAKVELQKLNDSIKITFLDNKGIF